MFQPEARENQALSLHPLAVVSPFAQLLRKTSHLFRATWVTFLLPENRSQVSQVPQAQNLQEAQLLTQEQRHSQGPGEHPSLSGEECRTQYVEEP